MGATDDYTLEGVDSRGELALANVCDRVNAHNVGDTEARKDIGEASLCTQVYFCSVYVVRGVQSCTVSALPNFRWLQPPCSAVSHERQCHCVIIGDSKSLGWTRMIISCCKLTCDGCL